MALLVPRVSIWNVVSAQPDAIAAAQSGGAIMSIQRSQLTFLQ